MNKMLSFFSKLIFSIFLIASFLSLLSNITRTKYLNFFPKIKFGLDIVGGSQIIVKIDNEKLILNKLKMYNNMIKDKLKEKTILIENESIDIENQIKLRVDQRCFFSVEIFKNIINSIDRGLDIISFSKELKDIRIGFSERYKNQIIQDSSDKTINILRNRLNSFGTKDLIIKKLNNDKIIIEISGDLDYDYIKNTILKTANLSMHFLDKSQPFIFVEENQDIREKKNFIVLNPYYKNEDIRPFLYNAESSPVIYGDFVERAEVNTRDFKPSILINMNKNASLIFSKITKNNVGRYLAIVLDDKVIMSPVINQHIPNGSGVINGSFSYKEASDIAMLLNSGSLDTNLSIEEEIRINPLLSPKTINGIYKAILLAVLLTSILMISIYKINGIIASISMILNIILLIMSLSFVSFAFNLPSIAGLLLTIGMSVDANIIIYEELKYKMRNLDKSIIHKREFITEAFKNAGETIIDSNFTTAIVAFALISIGSGFIRGFGISVLCGIITSLISCFFVTKNLMLNKRIINKILQ